MTSKITKLFVDASLRLRREETGATAVEYGLIVGLIAVVIIGAVFTLGGSIAQWFTDINTAIASH
jgi:pilus assembly protein Flp/PilA